MAQGIDGLLRDKTRPARIAALPVAVRERVVALTLSHPPGETNHWTWIAGPAARDGTTRKLGGHQPEIGHHLARIGKTREESPSSAISVAALTSAMPRIVCRAATTGASVYSGSIASICAVSRSRRASAASTAAM